MRTPTKLQLDTEAHPYRETPAWGRSLVIKYVSGRFRNRSRIIEPGRPGGFEMTECPSCRMVRAGRPKFCENCGHQFASDPKGSAGPDPLVRATSTRGLFAWMFPVLFPCMFV